MMGLLSWVTGVGLPSLIGFGLLGLAGWAWFQIPIIGKYLGLAGACVGVALLVSAVSFNEARNLCNELAVRAELASVRRDLDTAHEVAAKAAGQSVELAEAERINKELADEISRTPDTCIANSNHIKRLRSVK